MGEAKPAPRANLVYDRHCGSCTKFARLVRRLDTKKRITFEALDDAAVEARLRPRVGEAYDRSFHLELAPDGRVVSGEAALEDLARLLPLTAPLGAVAFKVPGVRGVPAVLYRAFAAGRACAADTAAQVGKD